MIFKRTENILLAIIAVTVFVGLFIASQHNYNLFHSLAELFSIMISAGIFMIAWNSRKFVDNEYLLFIGISFLFVSAIDLLHILTFKGMNILDVEGANVPTQLWIAARYLQSITLFMAPTFMKYKFDGKTLFVGYGLFTLLIIISIFYVPVFPTAYVEGSGLTNFKIISEYIISFLFIGAVYQMYQYKNFFDKKFFRLIVWSISILIVAELMFTLYISVFGFANILGHYLKIVSYYLLYKAIIEQGLINPYRVLFRNLKKSEVELQKYSQQLVLSNANKDKFFSIISHDLRSPFNGILGFTELLRDETDELEKSEIKDIAERLHGAASGVYSLLENLLQWSRIQLGVDVSDPEPVRLKDIVFYCVELMQHSAHKKNILLYVDISDDSLIFVDQNMLNSVLQNLISNAVKFTPVGGEIKIYNEMEDDFVVLYIQDTGIGMKVDEVQNLFKIEKSFTKKGTSGEKGSGLGLILTKELIEKNGGEIEAKSETDKGTTFILRIPLYKKNTFG